MQDDTPTDQQTATLDGQGSPATTGISREDLSIGLIAVGSIMMLIVIARMLGRRKSVQHADRNAPKSTREAAQPSFTSTVAHDRLERLMTDAEELTRRLAAVLENKAEKIEVLIEQADERLQALESAQADAEASPFVKPQAPQREGSTSDASDPPPPLSMDPLHRKVYDLADQGLTPVDIARQIDKPTGQVELILALRRA